MKIVCDKAIPYLEGVFEPYAEVVRKEGRSIVRDDLEGAEALIVRTRTACGAGLLGGTGVRIVASATIGTDHIDIPWCRSEGIEVASAPGCNALGVADYVMTAVYAVAERKSLDISGSVIGIVGAGHVGTLVAEAARKLGFRVLLCDPPRALSEGPEGFVSLERLLEESSVVTLHVPLDATTFHMAGERFFSMMRPGALFINSSRGDVVVERALAQAAPRLGGVVLDTWPGEPRISPGTVRLCDIATPHIAGYTVQGKATATQMVVHSVAECLGIKELEGFSLASSMPPVKVLHLSGEKPSTINEVLQYNYPIFTDDSALRADLSAFERLRSAYACRNEFRIE